MKILFAALHGGYFRNLESVVEELARRGHHVHLVSERIESAAGGGGIVERLAASSPNITCGAVPPREPDQVTFLASKIRLGLAYLRYLEPPYNETPGLVRRAEERTPRVLVRATRSAMFATGTARQRLARVLDALDHALPRSQVIERFLDEQRPDVALVTPLVGVVASSQLDLVRSAAARRIPIGVCVWSWDHLSSKAIIRDAPDRLFVWNETQQAEAVAMHGLPPERVVVTGAQCFDRWFDQQPARDRGAFCRRAGLPDDRPYILWVCSALFPGSPPEAEFVVRWIAQLRASADPALRDAAILIRPHPSRTAEWDGVHWRTDANVALAGGNPIDAESRADYFDALYHSAAVVGLNTSAFIEAGIVGRPVLAILPEEFHANQEGTLHFHYLTDGGLLTTARTLPEHARQLAGVLAGDAATVLDRQRGFVQAFVRPHGLQQAATPVMADAVEQLPRAAEGHFRARRRSLMASAALRLLLVLQEMPGVKPLFLDEREVRREAALRENRKRRRAEELARRAS